MSWVQRFHVYMSGSWCNMKGKSDWVEFDKSTSIVKNSIYEHEHWWNRVNLYFVLEKFLVSVFLMWFNMRTSIDLWDVLVFYSGCWMFLGICVLILSVLGMFKSTSIVEKVVIVFFCVSVFNTMGLFVWCWGVRGEFICWDKLPARFAVITNRQN